MTLFVLVYGFGSIGTGLGRPAFIVGCLAAGYWSWRESPARHLEVSLILFATAPFLRRVVDFGAGFDPSGFMLTGPLLAILIPTVELRHLVLVERSPSRVLSPMLLIGACIAYAIVLSLASGEIVGALTGTLKWIAPLLYGVWLIHRVRQDTEIVQVAARAFLFVTPIIGAYGVFQYLDPPAWDRYWMINAGMDSIGVPEPLGVRVFSTMNSPASFATFSATGLLLFGFCRSGWLASVMSIPCLLGLLLSLYRTAWLGFAVGVIFCMFFAATRGRAFLVCMLLFGAIGAAGLNDTIGDVILNRLETLTGPPAQDGSGQERLREFLTIYENAESTIIGQGIAAKPPENASKMPIDGMIIYCWLSMGIIVGLTCVLATLWAGFIALAQVCRRPEPVRVVLGAAILGALMQVPLAGVIVGEMGFLFWVCVALSVSIPVSGGATTGLARTLGDASNHRPFAGHVTSAHR